MGPIRTVSSEEARFRDDSKTDEKIGSRTTRRMMAAWYVLPAKHVSESGD
jgi:hypothetical protein